MKHFAALLAAFALSAATLPAQSSSSSVPESHRPPPGMCRIWIDGVPPAHQPAPTDCATAIRKRPLNARVVFGSEAPGNGRTFAPGQPRPSTFASPNATATREEQERAAQQREAQQQRDAQERQRAEAQRQHDEQQKRAASQAPPSPPPRTQERATPAPRPRTEHPQRPPHSSFSTRRPG